VDARVGALASQSVELPPDAPGWPGDDGAPWRRCAPLDRPAADIAPDVPGRPGPWWASHQAHSAATAAPAGFVAAAPVAGVELSVATPVVGVGAGVAAAAGTTGGVLTTTAATGRLVRRAARRPPWDVDRPPVPDGPPELAVWTAGVCTAAAT